jgi:hypothetical protein
MKNKLLPLALLALTILAMPACKKDKTPSGDGSGTGDKVLLLKVDYLTKKFEGGQEVTLSTPASSFAATAKTLNQGDFNHLWVTAAGSGDTLFYGVEEWMGYGDYKYPALLEAKDFATVTSTAKMSSFENIYHQLGREDYKYDTVWHAVANLGKTQEYIKANPKQTARIFLFYGSMGGIGPKGAEETYWKWIIMLNK